MTRSLRVGSMVWSFWTLLLIHVDPVLNERNWEFLFKMVSRMTHRSFFQGVFDSVIRWRMNLQWRESWMGWLYYGMMLVSVWENRVQMQEGQTRLQKNRNSIVDVSNASFDCTSQCHWLFPRGISTSTVRLSITPLESGVIILLFVLPGLSNDVKKHWHLILYKKNNYEYKILYVQSIYEQLLSWVTCLWVICA